MADFFRMARSSEYQPTRPSSEETGVNPSSFFGQSSVARSDFSGALIRSSNLRLSTDFPGLSPSTPASTFADQKCDRTSKNPYAPDCQDQNLTMQSYQRSVMLTLAEGVEHRVNIKL
jgi:hypothetical protein